jgi:flavin-binding protein dodecin
MSATEMKDHVYKILELVGSSEKSIEDAVQNAIRADIFRGLCKAGTCM